MTVTIGSTQCTAITFITDHTSFYCIYSFGSGSGKVLSVTVGGQTGTFGISYSAPVITSITQSGKQLSIVGTGFGVQVSDVSTIPASTPTFVSVGSSDQPQTLRTNVAFNSKNGPISVKVADQTSVPFPYSFTPILASLNPTILPDSGAKLTITGEFLSLVRADGSDTLVTILVGGQPCTSPASSQDATKMTLICTSPLIVGANLQVTVAIDNVVSNSLSVSYAAPTITSLIQSGTTLTIAGSGFGANTNDIAVSFNGAPTNPSSILTTPSRLLCTVTQGTGGNVGLTVTVGTKTSLPAIFGYALPTITSLVQTGSVVSLFGDNFGLNPSKISVVGQSSPLSVTFDISGALLFTLPLTARGSISISGQFLSGVRLDGSNALVEVLIDGSIASTNIAFPSLGGITCDVPAGTGAVHTITVTIDDVVSNSLSIGYQLPSITGPFTQNDQVVTLSGTNFGSNNELVTVQFGEFNMPANTTSDGQVIAYIHRFALSGQTYIIVDGQISNSINYILTPVIESITSPDLNGGEFLVSGLFLNDKTQDGSTVMSVTINNVPCTGLTKIQDSPNFSRLQCTAPAGSALTTYTLKVTIDGLSDSQTFTYGAPVIDSVSTSTSNVFTLTGKNFGTDSNAIKLYWGSTEITNFQLGTNTITFTALPGLINDEVYIIVGTVESNHKSVNLYPVIQSITTSPTRGGLVTVLGAYLNTVMWNGSPTSIGITLNNAQVTLVEDPTVTGLVFTAPFGTGFGHSVSVTIET
eukprot:gene21015-25238_t